MLCAVTSYTIQMTFHSDGVIFGKSAFFSVETYSNYVMQIYQKYNDTFIYIPEIKRPNMKFNLQCNDVTFRLITIIDLES